jgi:predicted dehydrogenase
MMWKIDGLSGCGASRDFSNDLIKSGLSAVGNVCEMQQPVSPTQSYMKRRSFLANTTLVGAGMAASSSFAIAQGGGSRKIKFGLIGCGGRGKGAARDFREACKILGHEAELVAVADAFLPAALAAGKQNGLSEDRCYGGFDSYHKVLATDCEFVLMATPPCFRPLHFAAAVEAGKHCFIEKPVGVDAPGCRSIIATGEKAAAKGLAVVTGTQRRHTLGYLRNKALIDAGAIGAIRGGVVQWNDRVPWTKHRKPGESDADYMARNWLNFTETSGDHIVEQHVHNLDVAVWFIGRLPVTALGFGGRARRETGNMFDFFSIDYDFGDGVHIHSQCRQLQGAYARTGEILTGAEGECLGGGKITGRKIDVPEIKLDTDNGLVQEHVDMIRSVMNGEPLNHSRRIAELTAVAIMGRISAYTGQLVRYGDLMSNESSPFYTQACNPTAEDFEKGTVVVPAEVPPVPGTA